MPRTELVPVGSLLADSYPFSSGGNEQEAKDLSASGISGIYGYLGIINAKRVDMILNADMGFIPVTLAGHYDGSVAVAQCKSLGLTANCSVVLDLEGLAAFHTDPTVLTQKVSEFASPLKAAGFMPCVYIGSPQPFTSDELWNLPVLRYWRGQGAIRDRFNALAEPTKCGWSCTQAYPSVMRGGVMVDLDLVGQDYLARVPNWMVL